MKELGLYSTDTQEIEKRVADSGMSGIFDKKLG
jgi:hypothetical protein